MVVMEGETTSGKPLAECAMSLGMEGWRWLWRGGITTGKPLAESVMAVGMVGAVVAVREGETTSSKP